MFRAYPSLFLLLAIVPGIVLADQFSLPVWIYLPVAGLATGLGCILLSREKRSQAVVALGLALFFFSAFHYSVRFYPTGEGHVANFADGRQRYHIFGQVSDWPRLRINRTELKVRVDSLISDEVYPVRGTVMLRIGDTTTSLQRGDRIEFYGRIYPLRGSSVPGGFDYQRYLNLKGVYGMVYLTTFIDLRRDERNRYGLYSLTDKLRAGIVDALNRNLSPRAAALAAGFLIGETRNIPADVYSWFRDSGTLHLLAVSGSNVALVLGFFIFLMRPLSLSRRARTAFLLGVLVLFTMVSYGEPSVVRASVMATLILLGRLVQRRIDLNNIISAAAAIILLVDPTQLFDVGFQLSFVTAWGLIFVTPAVLQRFPVDRRRWWYFWIVLPLVISIVAQLCSTPLIAYYFHRIPILSVPANLLIVLLTSGAVLGVLAVLLADFILPIVGAFVGSLLDLWMALILRCLQFFGGEEAPVLQIESIPVGIVIASYVYIVLTVWAIKSRRARRLILISLAILTNIALLLPSIGHLMPKDDTDIWLTTVPGGIAAIIRQEGQPHGDLVITGMMGRDYPIDDRILIPMLERLEVKTLRSIFVISADYSAIDDLIRTADKLTASRIVVPKHLEQSFGDAGRTLPGGTRIEVSPEFPVRPIKEGFYPYESGLIWITPDSPMLFVDRLDSGSVATAAEAGVHYLVVGHRLDEADNLWPGAVLPRLKSVVARSARQQGADRTHPARVPFGADSVFIIELDQEGARHLSFPR